MDDSHHPPLTLLPLLTLHTLAMLTQVIQRELFWFYPWLRRMTSVLMTFEKRSHTLQPTALANEVLSKLLTWHGEVSGNSEHSLR